MSLRTEFGATLNQTIDSTHDISANCGGASGVLLHILTVSSLTFTAQVALDGGATSPNYSTVPVKNLKTGAWTEAGTAITPAADDLYWIPVAFAEKVQVVRGAGSGTISLRPGFASDAGGTQGAGSAFGNTVSQVAFASAARALAQAYQSGDLDWTGAKAIRVNVVITAVTSTPSLVVRVLCKEPISGVYNYVTAAPSALTTTGHYVYVVGAGMVTTGGHIQQTTASMVPKTGAIEITHGDTDSATYSVSVEVLY